MYLHEASTGRDNNLNLLRFCAATLVVYAHSFNQEGEPFRSLFFIGAGDWGVDIFFLVSGFLICKSWLNKGNLVDFAWARFLRIYPALWVSNLFFVLLVGGLLSQLPLGEFLRQPGTISYLVKNSTMILGAQMKLPNLFDGGSTAFNIPLWTLPHELQMYMLLASLGLLGLARRSLVTGSLCAFGFFLWGLHLTEVLTSDNTERFRFIYHFFAGAVAYNLRARIPLRLTWFVAVLVILVCGALVFPQPWVRTLLLAVGTPYLVLWFAFAPRGAIRGFNRVGDYSYGIYILACPFQVLVLHLLPQLTRLQHFALSMAITLPLAMLSWHLLEKHALRLRQPRLLRLFGRWAGRLPGARAVN